jgi:hypothetical protein
MWGFLVDKVALGQVFPPEFFFFSCQFHSTSAPLLGKGQKIIIIFIFIGSHNKPHGCSASVASAAGPFITKKKKEYTFCNQRFLSFTSESFSPC